jgi:hypothetical protein
VVQSTSAREDCSPAGHRFDIGGRWRGGVADGVRPPSASPTAIYAGFWGVCAAAWIRFLALVWPKKRAEIPYRPELAFPARYGGSARDGVM